MGNIDGVFPRTRPSALIANEAVAHSVSNSAEATRHFRGRLERRKDFYLAFPSRDKTSTYNHHKQARDVLLKGK